jgi:hypothetical protein
VGNDFDLLLEMKEIGKEKKERTYQKRCYKVNRNRNL